MDVSRLPTGFTDTASRSTLSVSRDAAVLIRATPFLLQRGPPRVPLVTGIATRPTVRAVVNTAETTARRPLARGLARA